MSPSASCIEHDYFQGGNGYRKKNVLLGGVHYVIFHVKIGSTHLTVAMMVMHVLRFRNGRFKGLIILQPDRSKRCFILVYSKRCRGKGLGFKCGKSSDIIL